MKEQITGKEVVEHAEHMLCLLHKEWERSGTIKSQAVIKSDDLAEVYAIFEEWVECNIVMLQSINFPFDESLHISWENHVILRIVKKLKKAGKRTGESGMERYIKIGLDKEEVMLFNSVLNVRGSVPYSQT